MAARVLFVPQEVHPVPPLTGAAVEQWIDAVAHGLSSHEPHIACVPHPGLPDRQIDGQVHYHRIRVGRTYKRLFRKLTRLDPWSYIDRVIARARAIGPEVVHLHNAPQFVAPLRQALPGVRLVLHMHNEKETAGLPEVDALAGCSAYITRWYRSRGLRARRFAELPNGVDTARYRPRSPEERAALRARMGIPGGSFVVLYVGRISPEKGPDLLVDAVRLLDPAAFHLVLVGEWQEGDPARSARAAYGGRVRAALSGLPATVLGDFAPAAMPELYALGDLCVIPSRFEEPFSMVAIEAMASGVPVLALRKGGMAEYMADGENALVLAPDADAAALASAMSRAAREPKLLGEIAGNARAMVQARYTWAEVVARTERLYAELRAETAGRG